MSGLDAAKLLYKFPGSNFLENVVSVPDGRLLITSLQDPVVYIFDPAQPSVAPSVVAEIKSSDTTISGTSGIAPVGAPGSSSTVFAVVGSHFLMRNFKSENTSVWTFDVSKYASNTPLEMQKVATLPPDANGNGMIQHPFDVNKVLIADSFKGAVRSVDIATGKDDIYLQDVEMAAEPGSPGIPVGINGLRYFGGYLYWTCSNKNFVARRRVAWDPQSTASEVEAASKAMAEVVARAGDGQIGVDDFTVGESAQDGIGKRGDDRKPVLWIASHPNSLLRAQADGPDTVATVVVGGGDSKLLGDGRGTTSAYWGPAGSNTERTLYVVTALGSIVAVDTTKL